VTFLVAGTIFLAGRYHIQGQPTGFSVIANHGGLFPTGLFPVVIVTSGVVFAYAAVELVGTAAGETANAEKVMPRAINSVIARIVLFYVGSVFLLGLLLPYTAYKSGESPFVTFFSKIGVGRWRTPGLRRRGDGAALQPGDVGPGATATAHRVGLRSAPLAHAGHRASNVSMEKGWGLLVAGARPDIRGGQ
jgi:hypothetical protein